MKYTEVQLSQVAPEWREMCLDYETLKTVLYSAKENPSEFFVVCGRELDKVNMFFSRKVAESQRTFIKLCDVHKIEAAGKSKIVSNSEWFWGSVAGLLWGSAPMVKSPGMMTTTIGALKEAYKEFQYELFLLKLFQEVNVDGFRKILKKRDKVCDCPEGTKWKADVVDQTELGKSEEVGKLMSKVESAYVSLLGDDRDNAVRSLRVPMPVEKENEAFDAWWWIGFGAGTFVFFFAFAVASMASASTEFWQPPWVIIRIYRAPFVLLVSFFLYGVAVDVWTRSGVNHVLILELNPRKYLCREQIWSTVTGFSGLWAIALAAYLHLPFPGFLDFGRLHCPLIFAGICFIWSINPINLGRRSTRRWLWNYVLRYLVTPLRKHKFVDYWFGEQMTSLVPVCLDAVYTICLYAKGFHTTSTEMRKEHDWRSWGVDEATGADRCSSGAFWPRPFIASIPFLLMVVYCLREYCCDRQRPHLVNAVKYATTFPVIVFSALMAWDNERGYGLWNRPFLYLWVLSCLLNVVFTFIWDVRMDWGLCIIGKDKTRHLGENVVYEKIGYYYAAIAADAVMRLNWALVISPSAVFLFSFGSEVVIAVTALIECGRRCIWNIFVLQKEHLANVHQRRAVRKHLIEDIIGGDEDVPLPKHSKRA